MKTEQSPHYKWGHLIGTADGVVWAYDNGVLDDAKIQCLRDSIELSRSDGLTDMAEPYDAKQDAKAEAGA